MACSLSHVSFTKRVSRSRLLRWEEGTGQESVSSSNFCAVVLATANHQVQDESCMQKLWTLHHIMVTVSCLIPNKLDQPSHDPWLG
jgi:hypothetical protein